MEFRWTDFMIFSISIFAILYVLWRRKINEIRKKGLKFIEPWPLVGNMGKAMFRIKHITDVTNEAYEKFPEERYIAFFSFQSLTTMIRDPQLIGELTVKHFDHFTDHGNDFIDEELEPLFYKGLFSLRGERWKDMRASLTPAFTGSKMREMIPFIEECAKSLVTYINENIDKGDGIYETEAKALMIKCANDAIASCAFGLATDSFKNPENDFFQKAKRFTQFQAMDAFKMTFRMMMPKLSRFLGISIMKKDVSSYFTQLVKDIMENREKTGIVRRDMIHLLMLAKKGKLQNETNTVDVEECKNLTDFYDNLVEKRGLKQNWQDVELAAQAFLFMFAGFEPTSVLMSFLLYELTVNEECQKKLHEEIDEYIQENGKELKYAHINKLKYLDMVVSECLRLRATVVFMDRVCTKEFELPPTGNNTKGLKLNVKDVILIPTVSLHMDERYWENPTKFDPERFSDENKHKIVPNTYIPFGNGPRSCIGNRFVLMECKIFMFYIMANFNLKIIPRTEIPITLSNVVFSLVTKNGIWIGFTKRNNV